MATMNIELQPLDVPSHVYVKSLPGRRQDGIHGKPVQKIDIRELRQEVVKELLTEFCDAVWALHRSAN